MNELSEDQARAFDAIKAWLASGRKEFTLGGYAGTGKTTMVRTILQTIRKSAVLALTGKACRVLISKGIPAQTIHSAIYNFHAEDEKGDPIFRGKGGKVFTDDAVIVVDEASMVNVEIAEELRFHASRILWVGDHGQLEPIGDDPGIMKSPDATLEKIHRQAESSPIIRLAHLVREGATFREAKRSLSSAGLTEGIAFRGNESPDGLAEAALCEEYDQVIVGFNAFRNRCNEAFRVMLKKEDIVEVGDRLICLRNYRKIGALNGMIFKVLDAQEHARPDTARLTLEPEDGGRSIQSNAYLPCFGRGPSTDDPVGSVYFDYGYAITCHKSQGSEWDSVVVKDSPCDGWAMNRWRYTAVTRARSRLMIYEGGR